MSTKEEIKEVILHLKNLTSREKIIIDSFEQRLAFLSYNRKEVINIINLSKKYRQEKTAQIIEALKLLTQQHQSRLRRVAEILISSKNAESSILPEEELELSEEEKIFTEEIETASELEGQNMPQKITEKIERLISILRRNFHDKENKQELKTHLESLSGLTAQNIAEQEQLYTRELSILQNYTEQSVSMIELQEEELREITGRIEVLTLREKEEIILPINSLLKRKKDTETLFLKYLEGKNKITLEDVKEILRATTRTPEEVLRIQTLLIKNANLLDSTPLQKYGGKNCLDIISRYGLTALAISESQKEELKNRTTIDELTGLLSRGYFEEIASIKISELSQKNKPLSLLVIDGDKFKYINDTFGHDIGNMVIQFLASTIRRVVKSSDFVGRFGGDEFVVLFPETTKEQALKAAERIRVEVEKASQAFLQRIMIAEQKITITGGLATFLSVKTIHQSESKKVYEELFKRADTALINGKEEERNRIYSDEGTVNT